jgi:hypothetical protein
MEYFVPNREVIKNFAINTGTTSAPVYTNLCTTSELTLNSDFTTEEFFVFCDAIQRSVKTGVALTIEGTAKIDINNAAIKKVLGNIHTLITSGTISQFNNVLARFDLLTNVNNGVLEYTTYYVSTNFSLESLGGAAEGIGEFAMSLTINGTGSVSA